MRRAEEVLTLIDEGLSKKSYFKRIDKFLKHSYKALYLGSEEKVIRYNKTFLVYFDENIISSMTLDESKWIFLIKSLEIENLKYEKKITRLFHDSYSGTLCLEYFEDNGRVQRCRCRIFFTLETDYSLKGKSVVALTIQPLSEVMTVKQQWDLLIEYDIPMTFFRNLTKYIPTKSLF